MKIIQDLYTAVTSIVAKEGETALIDIFFGTRQGCPLSGLFNLDTDPVVCAVQGEGGTNVVLTYADDLTPLADDLETLQERINKVAALSA